MHTADVGFWEQHWHNHFSADIYGKAERGWLAEWFETPFTVWLPRQGLIVEAGCGLGHLVLALRTRGYETEGVEMASATVELVKDCRPDLPIRVGDVTRLDVPDGYYGGYISLGVVEHRGEGPGIFLNEAWRVLKHGGVALVSVPCFNPLRRFKARLRLYRGAAEGLQFYQYAFTEREFNDLMKDCGFEVVDSVSYDPFKGLKDEIPGLRRILEWRYVGSRLKRLLKILFRHCPGFSQGVGHMLLVVGKKHAK
jgi:SAM-dependent methyltransferase